jgi:hypothetical protein
VKLKQSEARAVDINIIKAKGYCFSLRKVRGIKNLADALFAFAFPQHQSDGGSVRQHMATRWLLWIGDEHATTWISNHWNTKKEPYNWKFIISKL